MTSNSKLKAFGASMLTIFLTSTISISTVVGASSLVARPTRPQIAVISVSGPRNGKVTVTVLFIKGQTDRRAPLIQSEVRVGKSICVAKKAINRCDVRNVASNQEFQVQVRSKNRIGYSAWSARVAFITRPGERWHQNTTFANNPQDYPAITSPLTPGSGPTSTGSLRFNLKNAVGLALRNGVTSAGVRKMGNGSNLQAVDASGGIADAVSSGSATISKFLIAPNNKLYLVFNSMTLVGSTMCLLAEVSRQSGEPVCIDSDLSSISWQIWDWRWENDPIQFDDYGSIYYMGQDRTGKATLRRYKNGAATSLVSDDIENLMFAALADGGVVISGRTKSTLRSWTRYVKTDGGLETLVSGHMPSAIARFPDGNVYMGFWGPSIFGWRRFLVSSSTMDSTAWISGNECGRSQTCVFDVGAAYTTSRRIPALESNYGTQLRSLVATSDNKVFAVPLATDSSLVQLYPNVSKTSSAVTAVGVMQRVLNDIILAGTNSNGRNVTTLYDTSSDTERVLIPESNEIEVYHINYVPSSNKVMFDGLRFADNKYVLGQIDLSSGQVSASPTGSSKLIDFQTFAS